MLEILYSLAILKCVIHYSHLQELYGAKEEQNAAPLFMIWCLLNSCLLPPLSFALSWLVSFISFHFLQIWLSLPTMSENPIFFWLCLSYFTQHDDLDSIHIVTAFHSPRSFMCVCEYMHYLSQRTIPVSFPRIQLSYFLRHGFSLSWVSPSSLARLATEPARGTCLFLPLQHWDCKCASMQVRGEWTPVVLLSYKDHETSINRTER